MILEIGIGAAILLALKKKNEAAATGAVSPVAQSSSVPDVHPMSNLIRYVPRSGSPENSSPFWTQAPGAPVITNPPIIPPTNVSGGQVGTAPISTTTFLSGGGSGGGGTSGGGGVGGGGGGMLK